MELEDWHTCRCSPVVLQEPSIVLAIDTTRRYIGSLVSALHYSHMTPKIMFTFMELSGFQSHFLSFFARKVCPNVQPAFYNCMVVHFTPLLVKKVAPDMMDDCVQASKRTGETSTLAFKHMRESPKVQNWRYQCTLDPGSKFKKKFTFSKKV